MRCLWLILVLFGAALLLDPPEGESCGPFLPDAQFVYLHNPGPGFVRGELGIVQPKYFRRNLVVAYRYLSGVPLSAEEVRALGPVQWPSVEWPAGLQMGGPVSAARWLQARNAVPGVQPLKEIDVYRHTMIEGYYAAYQNCMDDAFDSAAQTLAKRIRTWGAKSALVAEWLRGQDEVFANCGGDQLIFNTPPPRIERAAFHNPAPLPPGADPLLAADRQYQTAAAAFYGAKYKDAEQAFQAVGANANSPWRNSAQYLIARTLIREGTVDGSRDALARAETALRAILKDPAQENRRASAQGLLEYVQGHLDPEGRMVELGEALSKPGLGDGIRQAMTDYTSLWDRVNKGPAARSDLADWITAFQTGDRQHAVERWRKDGGAPWLVAALAWAQGTDSAAAELIVAAQKLGTDSPAYATAAFHGIRLETARGARDAAREWADEALAAKLPLDARNALLAQRMALARDWPEFLRFAPRSPVAATAAMSDESLANYRDMISGAPVFDWDAAEALNRKVPLELWVDASRNSLLPPRLQAEVTQAGWVRAVIVGRAAEARQLAARLAEVRPELAQAMRQYAGEQSAASARFDAVFLILHNPGLSPVVREGFGRYAEKPGDLNDFRDNWWNLAGSADALISGNPSRGQLNQGRAASEPATFLPAAQRAQGEAEWKALVAAAAAAPNYLGAETIAWAQAHPQDPRAPEALHLAVRATRYGQRDAGTSAWSKKTFQLLHAKYPRSEWAKKTKYWY